MSRDERRWVVPHESGDSEPPGIVREAESAVTRYGWKLTGIGAGSIVGWSLLGMVGIYFPFHWVLVFLAALVGVFLHPLTRAQKRARGILQRWDEAWVQVDLDASGTPSDARVEVAVSMADRVIAHGSVGDRAKDAARALTEKVRMLVEDERRLRLFEEAGLAEREVEKLLAEKGESSLDPT